jgi:hypothetical protein
MVTEHQLDLMEERRRRDRRIWQDWCAGKQQDDIAAEHGITQPRVAQIVKRFRTVALGSEEAETYRQAFVSQLDRLRLMMTEIITLDAPPAYSNQGVMLLDERGRPVRDYTGKMNAARTIVAIIAQQAKILGVEAPARIDVSMTVTSATEAAKQAALQAQAFLDTGTVVEGEIIEGSINESGESEED